MGPATPTASPPKASRLPSCSSSFTNGYAVPSPTAASTINPMPNTGPKAGSRPPTIAPMQQSKRSSICLPPLDAPASHCCTGLVKQAFGKNLACTPRGLLPPGPGRDRHGQRGTLGAERAPAMITVSFREDPYDDQIAAIVSAFGIFDPRQLDDEAQIEILLFRVPGTTETPYLVHTNWE